MPLFSAFTPFGHLAFSGKKPKGQAIFEAMVASLGGNYSEDFDGLEMARLYAQAMGIASAAWTIERARNNRNPFKAGELLPELEREHGLIFPPSATLTERRAALAVRMLIPKGAKRSNVTTALSLLLGSAFVEYLEQPAGPGVQDGGNGVGVFARPNAPIKLARLLDTVWTGLGAPQTVGFAAYDGGSAPVLLVGEQLIVDPGGLIEAVTIAAVTPTTLTATFQRPHPVGTLMRAGYFPYWVSTKRHNVIVLTSEAAADPVLRARVHELLNRIMRGVSTWNVADASGPFTVGVGKLGITTIGAI